MTHIYFTPKDYLNAVRDQFATFMKPDQLRQVMRTAAKRLAKHNGHISKYDGQGHLREGFPAAGDTGGRPVYPYALMKFSEQQAACVKRRQSNNGPKTGARNFKYWFDRMQKSHGPSRKMFVERTDGGNGP